jgi:hypothetical protein
VRSDKGESAKTNPLNAANSRVFFRGDFHPSIDRRGDRVSKIRNKQKARAEQGGTGGAKTNPLKAGDSDIFPEERESREGINRPPFAYAENAKQTH